MTVDSMRTHSPGLGRHAIAVLIGLAGLLPAAPVSFARDATSQTTISVAVLPVEFTPMTTSLVSAGAAAQAGTVSSQFVRVQADERTERPDDVVLTFIVSDDRGTAAGWDVKTNFASAVGGDDGPTLIGGCDNTIQRILPEKSRQTGQIHGGRTLGQFESPVSVLQAAPGSGAGVYVQELIVVLPDREFAPDRDTIVVHLAVAP